MRKSQRSRKERNPEIKTVVNHPTKKCWGIATTLTYGGMASTSRARKRRILSSTRIRGAVSSSSKISSLSSSNNNLKAAKPSRRSPPG